MHREARGLPFEATVAALGIFLGSTVCAEVVPSPGKADSRVRVATYDGEQVYRLHGLVGYQIDLEFEPGERFVGLGAGDIEGLVFSGEDNHLFLKPKVAKVATNLTILTNRRHYQIDYSAAAERDPGSAQIIYAVRFLYPELAAQKQALESERRIDAALERASTARPRNVDYWYCGESSLRPTSAWDDGVHTRLRFAANAELPAIFVRNADDSESLLNFSIDAGDVVIHRVARQFILRRGRSTGCVVNQGFSGGGLRLESGTVTPEVRRDVPGARP